MWVLCNLHVWHRLLLVSFTFGNELAPSAYTRVFFFSPPADPGCTPFPPPSLVRSGGGGILHHPLQFACKGGGYPASYVAVGLEGGGGFG